MYSPFAVALTVCLYVAALFGVALWGERSRRVQNALIRSGSVYALSLAVYCTSWTYYGSVGKAATSGVLFLTIYLGPTLGVFFFWILLRRLIRAKNRFRITSIADFIAARYGKSQVLAAVATLIALIGTVPYISLQLKAVVSSFRLITTAGGHELPSWLDTAVGPAAVVLMFAFTVLFGVRHLDPTERHRGMMMALAAECLVKLGAFLACGVFVTFFLFDGFSDIVRQVQALPAGAAYESLNHAPSFVTWSTFMLLAASAFFFLPRQFHVAVIENSDERHIRTAQWVLPTYLLLVNVFVLPIALAGLLLGHPAADADSFVLRLPLEAGQHALSLIIFLGGFSAAMGMVVICAMTMSTMVTNHLLLPVIEQASRLHFLRRHLLRLRWGAVAAFLGISYVFTITVGDSYMLVNMGMLSFAAVLQFAPAVIGGLFWSKANRLGALAGMGSGFVVWSYTLFLPALVKSGWLPETIMTKGPAGLAFLRPENLAGMTGLDPLSHAVFWTLIVNISSYVVVSLLARTGVREDEIRHEFLELLSDTDRTSAGSYGERTIALEPKTRIVGDVLAEYLPAAEASEALARVVVAAGVGGRDRIAIPELAELFKVAENHLAGSVGSAAAYHAMRHAGLFTDEETRQLSASYHDLLAEMKVSPAELRLRVSAYREREETIRLRAGELQSLVESRTEQLRATNDSLMEEIATREKAQEEMERMHKRFVEASHRAGMAEVANNVLHNVGNILNSVQVSSTVL